MFQGFEPSLGYRPGRQPVVCLLFLIKICLAIVRDLEYNIYITARLVRGGSMLSFISAKEAAKKWNVSHRRVSILCSENRIAGAMMVGNMWIIPSNAEKPTDKRTARYDNEKIREVKPFVKWVGGKSQLIGELEKMLPADGERILTKYAEPMVGGGALFFSILSKYYFKELYICDINAELINAYNVIKTCVGALIVKLSEIQAIFLPMNDNGRKYYYYSIRDKFNALQLSNDTA
ncbi:MAG: hypothetical protein EOM87_09625, partial [Clostridia bacterium]|nr:hypothetical protein [Clostridia bacterium]